MSKAHPQPASTGATPIIRAILHADPIPGDPDPDTGIPTANLLVRTSPLHPDFLKPLDRAIQGREEDYEEVIALYQTYGGA